MLKFLYLKKNEVLIKVFSCGLNRADLMVADGGAHGSSGGSGTIVGMEFSGEIIEFGSEVNVFQLVIELCVQVHLHGQNMQSLIGVE